MVDFFCDDKDIEKILKRLCKLVIANGAVLHEKLIITCTNGNLQIMISEEVPSGNEIISLPKKCLLPISKYNLDLQGYKIVMLSHDIDISEDQVAMMEAMIDLFNLTGKIEEQSKTSTFSLLYKDKDFLQRIIKSRSKNSISFLSDRKKMNEKLYHLKSFLKTRTLGIKKPENDSVSVEYLMPIIDCLNNHAEAIRYTPRLSNNGSPNGEQSGEVTHITVVKSCPVVGSKECYVNYGPYDSMDILIQYNYPDASVFFVRSVPVQIELPDKHGTIEIRSMAWEPQHKNLPEKLKNIEFYIPEITVNVVKDKVMLNFLYIPSNKEPNAMRQVLAMALGGLELKLEQSQMMGILQFIEKRIIDENIKYHENFSEYLKHYKPEGAVKVITDNTSAVIATQLNHIKNYKLYS